MPSEEHETLVRLFRADPRLAVAYLLWLDRMVPRHAALRLEPGTLQQKHPGGYRVDVLVLLLDAAGAPVLAVVVELQRGRDARKRRTWPTYQESLKLRYGCPVELVVVPMRADVARWLAGMLTKIREDRREPQSLADATVPLITEVEEARASPEFAVFSVYWHGKMGTADERLVDAAFVAVQACAGLEPEKQGLYFRLMDGALTDEQARDLEARMTSAGQSQLGYFGRKSFNEGLEQGRVEGLAQGAQNALARSLAQLLELKFGPLSAADAGRVAAADAGELELALQRVLTSSSVDEVLGH